MSRRKATTAEMDERLVRAEAGIDAFPHMPDWEVERCEWCGRSDWEVPGNCLARVRKSALPLRRLLVEFDRLEAALWPLRGVDSMPAVVALNTARRLLADLGVSGEVKP